MKKSECRHTLLPISEQFFLPTGKLRPAQWEGLSLVCDSREVPAAEAAGQSWAPAEPRSSAAPSGCLCRCSATSGCATGVPQMLAAQASWL